MVATAGGMDASGTGGVRDDRATRTPHHAVTLPVPRNCALDRQEDDVDAVEAAGAAAAHSTADSEAAPCGTLDSFALTSPGDAEWRPRGSLTVLASVVSPGLARLLYVYFFATLATLVKTIAWWFNQWPITAEWSFLGKWAGSAAIAGCEYLPMTYAMQTANKFRVHLSVMTAYMEASDNMFRMLQQVALGKPLAWYDWVAAFLLVLFVVVQGHFHWRHHLRTPVYALPPPSAEDPHSLERVSMAEAMAKSHPPADQLLDMPVDAQLASDTPPPSVRVSSSVWTPRVMKIVGALVASVFLLIIVAASGGATGHAYALGTLATFAKTFAWWINQYPQVARLSFLAKWGCGWSIAAILEYFPLLGAFYVASVATPPVHLGLLTAYMEALDNLLRVGQQYALQKPLFSYDYLCAAAMVGAVIFQGVAGFAAG